MSETLDWARTLVLLGAEAVDAELAARTANILLKYQSDIAKAAKELTSADGLADPAPAAPAAAGATARS